MRGIADRAHDPYRQGQLDGLCGLYSVINAIALLTAPGRPLGRRRSRQLFAMGLDVLEAQGDLAMAIRDGIQPALWFAVVRTMVADVEQRQGVRLVLRHPFADDDEDVGWAPVRGAIESALDAHAVVLVQLFGNLRHYSVIATHTSRRFVLHDSSGLRWLTKAGCGTEAQRCRHHIVAGSLATLAVMT